MPGGRFGKYGDLKRIAALQRGRIEKARLSRAELRAPGGRKGSHPSRPDFAPSPAAKTFKTAVVAIPPEALWEPIQALRKTYDRHVRRWMPHITLIYPFRPAPAFERLAPLLARACRRVAPFEVRLARFGLFGSSRQKATFYLVAEPVQAFKALHTALLEIVPDCNDVGRFPGGFTPHLSVGQVRARDVRALCCQLQDAWQPLSFTLSQICLIQRNDPPDDIFRIGSVLPVGSH